MAIGKISGVMLKDNLERQGVNLSFDGNLVYLDVTARRLGIGTTSPQYSLDVPANVRLANLTILGNTITSNTGRIGLGSISSLVVTGGAAYNVILTDGSGNLRFGTLDEISGNTNFTGNTIELGLNSAGTFGGNALTLTEASTITNVLAEINQLLGNITNTTGTELHVSGNVNSTNVNTQTLYATDVYGNVQTVSQPYITNVGTLLGLTIDGNLTVNGNTTFLGFSDLTIADSILNLHTTANLVPWTSNDGKDIGIKMHYYDTQDSHAALIRANNTGYLEWYSRGIEGSGNVFLGNAYGVIKTGEMIVANTTPSTGANTGALIVYGGASIAGNLYIGNLQADLSIFAAINDTPIGNAIPSTGAFTTLYATDFSTANAVISSGYIEAMSNATITYGNITTLDTVTANIQNLTSANAQISSGYADNFPIGANIAAPGRFTTVVTTEIATVGGNLVANSGTASNNTTTGALVVIGGAGISGNINAGNTSVNQLNSTTGIINSLYAVTSNIGDTVANTATIGNLVFSDTTVTHADVFVFNSNSAIQVPVGNSGDRPTGANGMIRYNTDTPALEYYNGTIWVPVTNTVTDQQITADGTNNTFTLDQQASTVGVIVSINGTLQRPTSAYTVATDQITFTETPEATDVIDVRFLGAAVTVSETVYDDLTILGNLTLTGLLSQTPTTKTSTSPGTAGQISWDADWIYVCTAANTWKRVALSGGSF